jgi:ribonucleoside-diphosphate reductase alpha chain
MHRLEFLPNSPTLMNAGLPGGQLAACFVLPIKDDLDSIFTALSRMARIHQSGGGTGFSFSALRPREDRVRSTGGVTSGPLSFMDLFDHTTAVIRQGGRRRGANMAVLRIDHPDIEAFIDAKRSTGRLENFNLSVGVTNAFFAALDARTPFALQYI